MRLARASLISGLLLAAVLVGVSSAAAVRWRNLQSATVTVQNGSLPPPYGAAHVTHFTTAKQLAKVTTALNVNHIAQRSPVANNGCAGGFNVTIKLVEKGSKPVTLSGYRCGTTTYGAIAGNVPGFLSAVGISA